MRLRSKIHENFAIENEIIFVSKIFFRIFLISKIGVKMNLGMITYKMQLIQKQDLSQN